MATPVPTDAASLSLSGFARKPFSEWALADATEAVGAAVNAALRASETDATQTGTSAYDRNFAFAELHDHWQDGENWVGPDGGDDSEVRDATMEGVRRQFTPVDVIGEALDRIADAVTKVEPDIAFVPLDPTGEDGAPSEAQENAADAVLAVISAWWDKARLWRLVRQAVKRSRWSGRGALRVWVAPGDRAEVGEMSGLPQVGSMAEALARVRLSAPEPNTVTVYTNPRTQKSVAIFLGTDDEGNKTAELWYESERGAGGDITPGVVVCRLLTESDAETKSFNVPLAGRLPIALMECDPLITEPVRRQQNRLNFAESIMVRVMETSGFRERYPINALPNGVWSETAPTDGPPLKIEKDDAGTTWYLHRAPYTLGAGVVTELQGYAYSTDDAGGKGFTTPSIVSLDPVDPEYAIKACSHARATILRSVHQAHVLRDSDLQLSGLSQRQARADFENDLANTKGPLEAMLRDTLEAALALAGAMSSEARDFLGAHRCVVNVHIDTGPVSVEEIRENAEQVKAGLLSESTAMARNGVEDVDAELQRIQTSDGYVIDLAKRRGEAMTAITAAGARLEGAIAEVGIEDAERVKMLTVGPEDERNTDPANDTPPQGTAPEDDTAAQDDPEQDASAAA